MNNTCTEEAEALHNLLDKKIEEYILEAEILMKESYDESATAEASFMEVHLKQLQEDMNRFESLFAGPGQGEIEEFNLFFNALLSATTEGFLKGYMVGRLGIQAGNGNNPYNWQYLAKKYIEIMKRQESQGQEVQHV